MRLNWKSAHMKTIVLKCLEAETLKSTMKVIELRNQEKKMQLSPLIPMECKNSGKLYKYILLLIEDEMITNEDHQGFKYSLMVSLGEEVWCPVAKRHDR